MSYNTNHLSRTSWNRISETVRKRDREICQYCGQTTEDGEPDHILPLSKGGRDSFDNLVWSCQSCNREKQGKTLREWLEYVKVKYCNREVHEQNEKQKPGKFRDCKTWLLNFLRRANTQPLMCATIMVRGLGFGYKDYMINRAKRQICLEDNGWIINSVKSGPVWYWELEQGQINAND